MINQEDGNDLRIRRGSTDTLQKVIHLGQFNLEQGKKRAETC